MLYGFTVLGMEWGFQMLTAKEIRKKCDEEIKKLQEVCDHSENEWMNEYWAPAHSTGRIVRACTICEKTLEVKSGEEWD